jgi:class 3 adenylate cyclase
LHGDLEWRLFASNNFFLIADSHAEASVLFADLVGFSAIARSGIEGAIQVSESAHHRLRDEYVFTRRGESEVRGIGRVPTHLLQGRAAPETGCGGGREAESVAG